MTQQSEWNKAIAEFDGLIVIPAGTKTIGQIKHPEISEAFLKYDVSWDAMMPVVEKINNSGGDVYIRNCQCNIHYNMKVISVKSESTIDAVYSAVIQFIQWYKSINKTTQS